jgi:hypothetical protein
MAGFTVWSPFDGQPIPAPNGVERDILLSQGYLCEEPDKPLATGGLIDPSTRVDLVGENGPELWDLAKSVAENLVTPPPDEP